MIIQRKMKGVLALFFLAVVATAVSARRQDLYDELEYLIELEEAYDDEYYYYEDFGKPGFKPSMAPPPEEPEVATEAPKPLGPGPFPTNCGVNRDNNQRRSLDRRDLMGLLRGMRDADDLELMKRIMGGQEAKRGTYPWIAFLVIEHGGGSQAICGGSLIHEQWVVSAGHCFFGSGQEGYPALANQLNRFTVVLGEHDNNPNVVEPSEQTMKPSKIIVHPGYNPNSPSEKNDIALIKLPKAVTFNEYVRPICMPDRPIPKGTTCHAAGWGKNRKGKTPDKLHDVKLVTITNKACNYYHPGKVTFGGMMCATHPPNKKMGDSCEGDSGGPLSCLINGTYVLTGATSFGVDCEKGDKAPGVYANVFFYRSWIEKTITSS